MKFHQHDTTANLFNFNVMKFTAKYTLLTEFQQMTTALALCQLQRTQPRQF